MSGGDRAVIPKNELEREGRVVVRLGRREVLVLKVGDAIHAVFNRCPHRQAPLAAGPVRHARRSAAIGEVQYDEHRNVLLCPWHRYEFDVETGRCAADPERLRVATYEVRVEGDDVVVYA